MQLFKPIIATAFILFQRSYSQDEWQTRRPRASDVLAKDRLTNGAAGQDVECAMRSVAYDMAMKVETARRHSDAILESLNASACPNWTSIFVPSKSGDQDSTMWEGQEEHGTNASCCPCNNLTIYVDCEKGSDSITEDNGTCVHRPLKTLYRAQEMARELRLLSSTNSDEEPQVVVYIRKGICSLNRTLLLSESNIAWKAFPGERPVISGGALLTNLTWSKYTQNIFVTDLPPGVNASAIDGLFTFPKERLADEASNYGTISSQIRLIRARWPNGNSEVDRMPTNYDKLGGRVSSTDSWTAAGNVSVRFPAIEKNSSFYPWFGHSNDVRWVQDYHLENASSYYGTRQQFWHPPIATATRYQKTHSQKKVNSPSFFSWGSGEAIIHVIHYNWWGNWQWEVEQVRNKNKMRNSVILEFGKGGWQDAHGGAVVHNYFFIENLLVELDTPGEWFVDKLRRKLYYWPLSDHKDALDDWDFAATQIPELVRIQGQFDPKSNRAAEIVNVSMEGITFAHSTTMFVIDRYIVPSAGDWSILPKGAVTINRAANVTLDSCSWLQVNGNGLALFGMVKDSTISKCDFIKIGDSGIVSVGYLPKSRPYSGFGLSSFPSNITISKSHFSETGVYGKQTSALFVALSSGIKFIDNVVHDGPRAGININDGFGGGHTIARNVIWNQVLESGDHGPINTWSRSAYMQENTTGAATLTPAWSRIDQNFIMIGPKFGSLYGPGMGPCSNGVPNFRCPKNGGSLFSCLDHDDGSEFYLDTRNVCAFAGMKNYIGQNKIWDSNLIVFPEGAESQNRSGTPCIWTSMDMAGDKTALPCSNRPCRTKEIFTNNTCFTYSSEPLEYDMFNETDLSLNGIRNTTIPYTANNRYFLNQPYMFGGKWSLSQAKEHGIDEGSQETSLKTVNIEQLSCYAREFLNLDSLSRTEKAKTTMW